MINGRQIRAARALLDWDAEQLAAQTGLSRDTIFNIEKGAVQARGGSIEKIRDAFDKEGVEFLDENGVRLRNDQIVTLTGKNVYLRLLDDIFQTLYGTKNPEASFFFVDNSKSSETVVAAHKRIRDSGIVCRYLCQENPSRIDFPAADYRGVPAQFFHNNAAVIYGDKYASMILDNSSGSDAAAIIIKNAHVAAAQHKLFNFIWSIGKAVK